VQFDRPRTPSDHIRAIIAVSGNANACTGARGLADAQAMAQIAADVCSVSPDDVLVMSTGVIGEFLPMERIAAGARAAATQLGTDEDAFLKAARGITTTDKSHKIAARLVDTSGAERAAITGMAKGAGMIGPRMATMLSLILTDARLTPRDAQSALASAVQQSFNCISVEGHMSTNDTVLLLASGNANVAPLAGAALEAFGAGLTDVCIELARMIADDGEGATHLITVEVRGCRSRDDARRIAQTIADSPLVKCAIHGGGPNWGRVVSAVGYAGVPLDPRRVCASINGVPMYRDGEPVPFDARAASKSIRDNRETHILVECAEGDASVRFWTSDLTVEYVKFNADFRT
jgi:glutamate N-acetyltransferase/amino-acid N-acetyltransferase